MAVLLFQLKLGFYGLEFLVFYVYFLAYLQSWKALFTQLFSYNW